MPVEAGAPVFGIELRAGRVLNDELFDGGVWGALVAQFCVPTQRVVVPSPRWLIPLALICKTNPKALLIRGPNCGRFTLHWIKAARETVSGSPIRKQT